MARGEGEQHGYDVGVAETEESLRAEVLAIYQAYCTQTWSEALNQAGVEALSDLRKPENIFYPPTIQASAPPSNYDDVAHQRGTASGSFSSQPVRASKGA